VEGAREWSGPRQSLERRGFDLRKVGKDGGSDDSVAVHLDDLSLRVQEQKRGEPQVFAAIEEIAAQDRVGARHLVAG